jgi:hypothetical protein
MDGGRISAGGYLYQYLRTAEAVLLALAADARVHACRVEGDPAPVELGDTDIVDFDLIDPEGKVLRSAQVKSGTRQDPLGPSKVFAILARLVEKGDAEEYVLLTSLDISAGSAEVTRALDAGMSPDVRRAALRPLLRGAAGQHLARLSDAEVQRLGRCRVSVDHRSRRALRDALLGAVRDLRRRDGRGIGEAAGGLLLDRLHWEIHRRAASPEDAVWATSDVRDVLRLDDHALVAALWDRDWGGVLGLMPPVPDVPRTAVLDEIAGFRHEVDGHGVLLGIRPGCPSPGGADVRLPAAAAARGHADPDRRRGVPGPAGGHPPPRLPAVAQRLQQP